MLNETLKYLQSAVNIAEQYALDTKAWQKRNKNNCVYLYGAGYLLPYYLRYLSVFGIQVTAILDTFKEGVYQNIPIIKYDSFLCTIQDIKRYRIFLSTAAASKEIIPKLEQHLLKENIFFVDFKFLLGTEDMNLSEYRKYIVANWNKITDLYKALSDEKSKRTLLNILRGHVSGNPNWFLDTLDPDLDYPKGVINFSEGEVLIEPGANDGSTFKEFTRRCPQYVAAYLFEPEPCFRETLLRIATKEKIKGKKVRIIPKGAWDSKTKLNFYSTAERTGSFIKDCGKGNLLSIETTTVDIEVQGPFSFMKMDIEGAEMNALRGAEKHILQYRPKLGVSVYHKSTDLLDVWNYLSSLVPDYHFYLRNHTPLWDDIILYAI